MGSMLTRIYLNKCQLVRLGLVKLTGKEISKDKEGRYSRAPRLSDTRYSAKGTKGKWRYIPAISIYGYDRFKRYGR